MDELRSSVAEQMLVRFDENSLVNRLRVYPPPPSGSRYIRTYKLRDGWRARSQIVNRDEVEITIENPVAYTGIVYSKFDHWRPLDAREWLRREIMSYFSK